MTKDKRNTQIIEYSHHYYFLMASLLLIFSWSIYHPKDFPTWILEALPVIVGFLLVMILYRCFPLTLLSYWLLWVGGILILVGAHYTYAEMPAFNWLRDQFNLGRNHYDRFGHFAQGAIPAIVFRELLLRTSPLKPGIWLKVIVISMCFAKSGLYEFAEWIAAISLGQTAHEFLGTQGDEWDAQKDMALALLGSIISLMVLSTYHDRQLKKTFSKVR